MIHKFITFIKDVLTQLKDPVNIAIYAVVLIATAYWLFWAGPFTPAMPIQFGITFALSKPVHKLIKHHQRKHGAKWL